MLAVLPEQKYIPNKEILRCPPPLKCTFYGDKSICTWSGTNENGLSFYLESILDQRHCFVLHQPNVFHYEHYDTVSGSRITRHLLYKSPLCTFSRVSYQRHPAEPDMAHNFTFYFCGTAERNVHLSLRCRSISENGPFKVTVYKKKDETDRVMKSWIRLFVSFVQETCPWLPGNLNFIRYAAVADEDEIQWCHIETEVSHQEGVCDKEEERYEKIQVRRVNVNKISNGYFGIPFAHPVTGEDYDDEEEEFILLQKEEDEEADFEQIQETKCRRKRLFNTQREDQVIKDGMETVTTRYSSGKYEVGKTQFETSKVVLRFTSWPNGHTRKIVTSLDGTVLFDGTGTKTGCQINVCVPRMEPYAKVMLNETGIVLPTGSNKDLVPGYYPFPRLPKEETRKKLYEHASAPWDAGQSAYDCLRWGFAFHDNVRGPSFFSYSCPINRNQFRGWTVDKKDGSVTSERWTVHAGVFRNIQVNYYDLSTKGIVTYKCPKWQLFWVQGKARLWENGNISKSVHMISPLRPRMYRKGKQGKPRQVNRYLLHNWTKEEQVPRLEITTIKSGKEETKYISNPMEVEDELECWLPEYEVVDTTDPTFISPYYDVIWPWHKTVNSDEKDYSEQIRELTCTKTGQKVVMVEQHQFGMESYFTECHFKGAAHSWSSSGEDPNRGMSKRIHDPVTGLSSAVSLKGNGLDITARGGTFVSPGTNTVYKLLVTDRERAEDDVAVVSVNLLRPGQPIATCDAFHKFKTEEMLPIAMYELQRNDQNEFVFKDCVDMEQELKRVAGTRCQFPISRGTGDVALPTFSTKKLGEVVFVSSPLSDSASFTLSDRGSRSGCSEKDTREVITIKKILLVDQTEKKDDETKHVVETNEIKEKEVKQQEQDDEPKHVVEIKEIKEKEVKQVKQQEQEQKKECGAIGRTIVLPCQHVLCEKCWSGRLNLMGNVLHTHECPVCLASIQRAEDYQRYRLAHPSIVGLPDGLDSSTPLSSSSSSSSSSVATGESNIQNDEKKQDKKETRITEAVSCVWNVQGGFKYKVGEWAKTDGVYDPQIRDCSSPGLYWHADLSHLPQWFFRMDEHLQRKRQRLANEKAARIALSTSSSLLSSSTLSSSSSSIPTIYLSQQDEKKEAKHTPDIRGLGSQPVQSSSSSSSSSTSIIGSVSSWMSSLFDDNPKEQEMKKSV